MVIDGSSSNAVVTTPTPTAPVARIASATMVPAQTAPTRFVSFFHLVSPQSVRALINTITGIVQHEHVKSLGLLISSLGGDVNEGVLLHNALRALPVKITTYNVGNVDSIANIVFLAGSHRVAAPSSTFLFHGVSWNVAPSPNVTPLDMKAVSEIAHQLDVLTARIKKIINANSALTMPELDELFLKASTRDAAFAVMKGLAFEIGEPSIPNMKALTHSPAA